MNGRTTRKYICCLNRLSLIYGEISIRVFSEGIMGVTVKLQQKSNSQYIITVPKQMVQIKDWKEGQQLEWVEKDGEIHIREAHEVS